MSDDAPVRFDTRIAVLLAANLQPSAIHAQAAAGKVHGKVVAVPDAG